MTPSIEELAVALDEIQNRAAIWQCLLRYARGVDRFDREMILSAFHPDAIDDHGKFVGGPQEFADWALGQHTKAHLGHLHNLFNHTCDLDGDVAHAETYFMFAAMNREGKPLVLNGGRYLDRLEKRDGEWRIAAEMLVADWSLDAETTRETTETGARATRDRSDPSYQRPLVVTRQRTEG